MPHFGWIKYTDVETGKFDITVESQALTDEEWSEYQKLAEFFARIRPSLIDFSILRESHLRVKSLPSDLRNQFLSENGYITKTSKIVIDSHILVEKSFSTFLIWCGIIRDRIYSRLHIRNSDNHVLKKFASDLYDSSFEYRLCHNLRNFLMHHSAPIDTIPLSGKDLASNPEIAVEIFISRDRLVSEMKKAQKRVISEIKEGPEKIEVLPLVDAMNSSMRKFFAAYISLNGDKAGFAIKLATVVRDGIRGMPKGAEPIIVDDLVSNTTEKHNDGTFESKGKIHPLSLDELEILEDIFPDLKTVDL